MNLKYTKIYQVKKEDNVDNIQYIEDEKIHQCQYCNGIYSNTSSLIRHHKICAVKKKVDIEEALRKEVVELKHELEKKDLILADKDAMLVKTAKHNDSILAEKDLMLTETIKQKDNVIKHLEDEIANLRMLVNNAGNLVGKSISAITYLAKHHNNAPILKPIEDISLIENIEEDVEFVDTLLHYYNSNIFDKYVGDFIIDMYKKDDPKEQAIWNTDINRLTYMIRRAMNNKPTWQKDNRGVYFTKNIINPILEYIKENANTYIQENVDKISKLKNNESIRLMKKLKELSELITYINKGTVSQEILKYVAPEFTLLQIEQ